MDGIENAVTPSAAPPPASSAPSPAPAATDRGSDKATTPAASPTGGGQSAPTPEIQTLVSGGAQSVPGQPADGDAAVSLFPSEEELRTAPQRWRDKFGQVKTGYDRLEGDHRELKGWAENWKGLEQFGDPAAIQSDLEILNGFRGYKTDEQGNIEYDGITGLPQFNVRPGIEALAKQSPAMPERLFNDLLSWQGQSGKPFLVELLTSMGLDPARLEDYKELTSSKVANTAGVVPVPDSVPEDRHEAFKLIRPSLQKAFHELLPDEQADLLEDAQEKLDDRKFKQEVRERDAQQAEREQQQKQREQQQFRHQLQQAQAAHVGQLRTETLDSIESNLVNQVTLSADPAINAVQIGAIKGTLAALLDPDLRSSVAPMLQGMGLSVDGLDAALGVVVQNSQVYTTYQAYSNHPTFSAHYDQHAMGQAKTQMDGALLRAKAMLNNVALKVAQALGGQLQASANQLDQQLANAGSRPVVNGSVGDGGSGPSVRKTGKPFSLERYAS